jgi:SAM-dependent methyltransferase
MDSQTIEVYNQQSDFYFEKYQKVSPGISKYFSIAFPKGSKILDIGCGSGKDVFQLLEYGYDAIGIDPCEKLVKQSVILYPEIKEKVFVDYLPNLDKTTGLFDGILCSAVFMHIPQVEIFDAIYSIKNHLNVNGSVLISIPLSYPEVDSARLRDAAGRLFNGVTSCQLILLFERLGFRLIEKWEDRIEGNSKTIEWHTLYLKIESSGKARPLDSIESVLNKDQKVATYKLALFRALSEIAIKNQKGVFWMPDGNVGLPIDLVSNKWIEYYWSIFASKDFIPQIQNESIDYNRPVAFRDSLTNLIEQYKQSGGLEGFIVDRSRLKLQVESLEDYAKVIRIIKKTLIEGPIKHSGGYNTPKKLFYYDRRGYIIIPGLIWKELTLLGPWIADSAILRWAELTAKFSKGKYKPSHIIDLLLVEESERSINEARRIYNQFAGLKCVWTSQLIKHFDVDHIIPFSLWKNNDLWNLVPSNPIINRNKSDKMVTNGHLVFVKDNIVSYWKVLHQKEPTRFINESKILTGNVLNKNNWENSLFAGLKEAIECTAIQRGIERWEPK